MPRGAEFTAIQLRELPPEVDVLAAVSGFRSSPYPWLLDSSAKPGEPSLRLARYSFAGCDPYLVLRAHGERSELEWRRPFGVSATPDHEIREGAPLEVLRAMMPARPASITMGGAAPGPLPEELPPFLGGAVTVLGYELGVGAAQGSTQPVELHGDDHIADLGLPDLVCLFVDRLLVVDHASERAWAVGLGAGASLGEAEESAGAISALLASSFPPEGGERDDARRDSALQQLSSPDERRDVLGSGLPSGARASLDESHYIAAVEEIRGEIAAGNVYQANLTQRIDLECGEAPRFEDADLAWSLYRGLRRLSPAPFASYLELPEAAIVSSSPERFLCLDRSGAAESRPIKGTRPRGATPDEDARLAKELAESAKDRAENLMIVDLVRNDLGRVCETGSIEVPERMVIESYATVFQMVSSVTGRLRPDCDAVELIRASFPPGSMTGAPKIAAMRIIEELEPVRRGIYSGAIGYLDVCGGMDLSVVIRTLLVREGRIHLHSGGAVVTDSDPRAEYREALDKIRALLAAIAWVREEDVAGFATRATRSST